PRRHDVLSHRSLRMLGAAVAQMPGGLPVSTSRSGDEARRGSRSDSKPVQPPPGPLTSRPVWDWFPDRTWLVAIAGLVVGSLLARLIIGPLAYAAESVLVGAFVVILLRRLLHRRAR